MFKWFIQTLKQIHTRETLDVCKMLFMIKVKYKRHEKRYKCRSVCNGQMQTGSSPSLLFSRQLLHCFPDQMKFDHFTINVVVDFSNDFKRVWQGDHKKRVDIQSVVEGIIAIGERTLWTTQDKLLKLSHKCLIHISVPFASKTAPTVKNQTVRLVLALAAKWNLHVYAADLSAGNKTNQSFRD